MRIELSLEKSLQQSADEYYAKSKKAKKKLAGLERGVLELGEKLSKESGKRPEKRVLVRKRQKKWFEKFHWFFTSEGFLVIGGRDSRSNELVVKKHMDQVDIYFHADVQGAPHVVMKTTGKEPGEASMREAAVFAAAFSKAWREQIAGIDVYSAKPGQVSKSAPSGESLGTGAFMVYGKREWFKRTPLGFAIGYSPKEDPIVFSGPRSAVKARAEFYLELEFGSDSKGAAAKRLHREFSKKGVSRGFTLEEIESLLPSGGIRVVLP